MWFILLLFLTTTWAKFDPDSLLFSRSILTDKVKQKEADEMEQKVVKLFMEKMKSEEKEKEITKSYLQWREYIDGYLDEKQYKVDRRVVELLAKSIKFPRPKYFHKILDKLEFFLYDIHRLAHLDPVEIDRLASEFIKIFNSFSLEAAFPELQAKASVDHEEL